MTLAQFLASVFISYVIGFVGCVGYAFTHAKELEDIQVTAIAAMSVVPFANLMVFVTLMLGLF